ncbi:MAG: hypothetical protein WDN06_07850 [Asticcacaulis sp.]
MKIGFADRQAGFIHVFGDMERDMHADMRRGNDKRSFALMKIEGGNFVSSLKIGRHGYS